MNINHNFEWHQPQFQKFLFSEAKKMLNTKLKHPIENIFVNKSLNKKKSYKYYYYEEMIELVNKKCHRELKYFNYDFTGSTKHEP